MFFKYRFRAIKMKLAGKINVRAHFHTLNMQILNQSVTFGVKNHHKEGSIAYPALVHPRTSHRKHLLTHRCACFTNNRPPRDKTPNGMAESRSPCPSGKLFYTSHLLPCPEKLSVLSHLKCPPPITWLCVIAMRQIISFHEHPTLSPSNALVFYIHILSSFCLAYLLDSLR